MSYSKNYICKFMQVNLWHHKLFHSHLPFWIWKVWNGREKIRKVWTSQERKKLLRWNKNLLKNSGHKLQGSHHLLRNYPLLKFLTLTPHGCSLRNMSTKVVIKQLFVEFFPCLNLSYSTQVTTKEFSSVIVTWWMEPELHQYRILPRDFA